MRSKLITHGSSARNRAGAVARRLALPPKKAEEEGAAATASGGCSKPEVISTGEDCGKTSVPIAVGRAIREGAETSAASLQAGVVWDRVYNGFGMPPWKDVYTDEEVVAIVAYVMSDDFFP